MASINPISSSLRLILSIGESEGKDVTKTLSFRNINVSADADKLDATAKALSTLVEHPVIGVRTNKLEAIVE